MSGSEDEIVSLKYDIEGISEVDDVADMVDIGNSVKNKNITADSLICDELDAKSMIEKMSRPPKAPHKKHEISKTAKKKKIQIVPVEDVQSDTEDVVISKSSKKKTKKTKEKKKSKKLSSSDVSDVSDADGRSQEEIVEPKKKKPVGRPKKSQVVCDIPKHGIRDVPMTPGNNMEWLHDKPTVIKQLFQYFKTLSSLDVQIIFKPDSIVFYTVDHHSKSKIYVKVDMTQANYYYVSHTYDVGVSCKDMISIFSALDKDYTQILFCSGKSTYQENIDCILTDSMGEELFNIELISKYNKLTDETPYIDEDYTISLQLPSKNFKKTISDISRRSDQLGILQNGNDNPLLFEYIHRNKKVHACRTIKDSKDIITTSKLQSPDDTFRIDIDLEFIKPISNNCITKSIILKFDENKQFMTKSIIDGMIHIKTLTVTIDDSI